METIIAIGSNRPHGRHGRPEAVVRAAVEALCAAGVTPLRLSSILATAPLSPQQRRFANAVLVAQSALDPPALLGVMKSIERAFGRRGGRAWGPRVLDLDLIAWGEKVWRARPTVPHRAMHQRRFVLDPLVEVAPGWRHPRLNLTARQLRARLRRRKPMLSCSSEGP